MAVATVTLRLPDVKRRGCGGPSVRSLSHLPGIRAALVRPPPPHTTPPSSTGTSSSHQRPPALSLSRLGSLTSIDLYFSVSLFSKRRCRGGACRLCSRALSLTTPPLPPPPPRPTNPAVLSPSPDFANAHERCGRREGGLFSFLSIYIIVVLRFCLPTRRPRRCVCACVRVGEHSASTTPARSRHPFLSLTHLVPLPTAGLCASFPCTIVRDERATGAGHASPHRCVCMCLSVCVSVCVCVCGASISAPSLFIVHVDDPPSPPHSLHTCASLLCPSAQRCGCWSTCVSSKRGGGCAACAFMRTLHSFLSLASPWVRRWLTSS